MQRAWAIAAASLAALAYLPLLAGIVRGTVREERLSWAIWALEYALLAGAQAARGGGPLLWLIGAGTAGCFVTFGLTCWRGNWVAGRARVAVLAGALAAAAAWQHTRNPALAFVFLLVTELTATVLTIINAWRYGTESVSYWLFIGLTTVLEIPALALGRHPPPPLSYAFTAAAGAGAAAVLAATAAGRHARRARPPQDSRVSVGGWSGR